MKDFDDEKNLNNDVDESGEGKDVVESEDSETKSENADNEKNEAEHNQQKLHDDVAVAAEEIVAEETAGMTGRNKIVKEIISWILCLVIAFAAAFVIRTWLFTIVKVDGRSMMPTLEHGERLFVRIIGYEPERGDIVIFHPKSNPDVAYVKRVIAVEGDRIWIDQQTGDVHLKKNGSDEWEVLDEDYIFEPALGAGIAQRYSDDSGEEGLLIKEDHVFVMGDNRNNSNDSRNDFGSSAVGQVDEDSIIGEAVFRWWPIDRMGTP